MRRSRSCPAQLPRQGLITTTVRQWVRRPAPPDVKQKGAGRFFRRRAGLRTSCCEARSIMTKPALNPLQLHALSIIGKKAKPVRSQLKVGKHKVDFTLRVAGTVNVGANYVGSQAEKIAPQLLIEALLSKIPKDKREAAVSAIIKKGFAKSQADCKATTELAAKLIADTTQTISGAKTGNVTGALEVFTEE